MHETWMKRLPVTRFPIVLASLSTVLFAGCAAQPKTLYYWGDYQPQVYEYFSGQGKSYADQIAALEQSFQEARARNAAVPPGYHAHLGLLYAKVGKEDQVRQQFETEKTLFPESSPYMDFLLRNFKE